MSKTRSALVASAAAALFLAGVAGVAYAEDAGAARIKCEGVNACKGHSECKSARNACKGKNGCAGQGFEMMTQAECDAAKAKAAERK